MNGYQENKLGMYVAVQSVCSAHPEAVITVPALAQAAGELTSRLEALRSLAQDQSVITTGAAAAKTQCRRVLCELAAEVAAATRACTLKEGHLELADEVKFSRTRLMKARDMDCVHLCENIHDAANEHAPAVAGYGVTAARLTLLQTRIDAYNACVQKPREKIASRRTVTTQLKEEFAAVDALLADTLDALVEPFRDTIPTFHGDYVAARLIVKNRGASARPVVLPTAAQPVPTSVAA